MEETIFDYDVTPDELKFIITKYKTEEEYLAYTDRKRQIHDLFVLFVIREDKYRAGEIKNLISTKKEAVNY